jgi:DNA polymerase-3 subunit delta|uniref:DNA polymerase III delta N-terminal domain-containing protein n=1 Tax=candidate division WOR-3 bacterium TaxID=2052148 RepID=A0A7C3UWU8_UNCW3
MKGMNSLFVLLGEDDIRAEEFIQEIKEKLRAAGLSFTSETLDCGESDISDIVERLVSLPLLADKRILILKNFASLLSDKEGTKEVLSHLKRISSDKESPVIAVVGLSWSKENEVFITKEGLSPYVCNFYRGKDWAIKREVKEKARRDGFIFEEDALSLLLDYTGEDYTQVYQEYEKIKLYAETHRITRPLLEEILSPVKRVTIQELGGAFRRKEKKTVLSCLFNLFLYSEKLENIIGYFTGILFRLLAEEKPALWERREIIQRLRELAAIDKRIKTTPCDGESLLFKWLLNALR